MWFFSFEYSFAFIYFLLCGNLLWFLIWFISGHYKLGNQWKQAMLWPPAEKGKRCDLLKHSLAKILFQYFFHLVGNKMGEAPPPPHLHNTKRKTFENGSKYMKTKVLSSQFHAYAYCVFSRVVFLYKITAPTTGLGAEYGIFNRFHWSVWTGIFWQHCPLYTKNAKENFSFFTFLKCLAYRQ